MGIISLLELHFHPMHHKYGIQLVWVLVLGEMLLILGVYPNQQLQEIAAWEQLVDKCYSFVLCGDAEREFFCGVAHLEGHLHTCTCIMTNIMWTQL